MSGEHCTPLATYRLQLRSEFGFDAVVRLAPYLSKLGVSHVYLSPCLQAGPDSTHGYDVVDHSRVSEQLGGAAAFAQMCRVLREHRLGLVVDIVPNHMSVANPKLNRWWWDVLENGPSSRYARCFDVDWDHPDEQLRNRVSLPILGDSYDQVIANRQIQVQRDAGSLVIVVYDQSLPVEPASRGRLLARVAQSCGSVELGRVADVLEAVPAATETDPVRPRHRDAEGAVIEPSLATVLSNQPQTARALDDELARINQDPAALDDLLCSQNYRLAHWRTANDRLNYRRFFNINELAALRTEDAAVFQATHQLVLDWARKGMVDGLRIDHPDGLCDPERYFRRLRDVLSDSWIVAEKILEPGEELPVSWPIDGTTGYDFLGLVGGLFVDGQSLEAINSVYTSVTGEALADYESLARQKKRLVLRELFASDLDRLTRVFDRVCRAHGDRPHAARDDLRAVLTEVLVWFGVYRTYVRPGRPTTRQDREIILGTVDRARAAEPNLDGRIMDLLSQVLCGQLDGQAASELVHRFQQLSGPVMAKAVEDTAFYCFHRLICLNEVGGSPGHFGTSVETFHRWCLRIQAQWPRTMLATSTHDTKRSEDARIRIALLSEIPDRWMARVLSWVRHNERHRTNGRWPDRPTEYLLYQTLVGVWPINEQRLFGYMQKAVREAKVHTSWTQPDESYEKALSRFCASIIGDDEFVQELNGFLQPLKAAAQTHALSQVLLKLCTPGVPDIYQGNELWDHSLTDPDNRRPVDFDRRHRLLDELETLSVRDMLDRADEGLPKLWLTHRVLHIRRNRPEAFGPDGGYRALEVSGRQNDRVISFVRGDRFVVVVPRLTLGLDRWGDTRLSLPPGQWRHTLVDRPPQESIVGVTDLLSAFPVALLQKVE